MFLQDLPIEILQATFDLLSQKDHKQLRLVSKAIKASTTLHFPRLFISPNRTNIDVFNSVVAHEEYSKGVEEIIWDDAQLTPWDREDLEEFIEAANVDTLKRAPRKMKLRKAELWGEDAEEIGEEESLRLYIKLYEEQEEIIGRKEDVETLRLGLSSLKNVKRVTLTSEAWRPFYLFPKYETPFFRSLPPGFKMPLPWPWVGRPPSLEFGEFEDSLLSSPWIEGPLKEWRGYDIVVCQLLATAQIHNVRELVIDVNREPTGICYQLFERPPNETYRHTLELFDAVPLTRLDLAINCTTVEEDSLMFFSNGLLQAAVSRLPALEHFHLHTNIPADNPEFIDDDSDYWIDLADIFPDSLATTWPHLRHLGLANFFTAVDSLYDVIATLAALRTIDLDNIIFTNESGQHRALLRKIKENLVDAQDGAWKVSQPKITVRMVDYSPTKRITVTDEISKFLYESGECPFLADTPGFISHPVGMMLDDFIPSYRMPHKLVFEPGEEEAHTRTSGADWIDNGLE